MKDYRMVTWEELNRAGYLSPVLGLDAVTTAQIAEYLHVPAKDLTKPRTHAERDLKALGMFTASAKNLLSRIPCPVERGQGYSYILPLVDGKTIEVQQGPTVYLPAPAVARLIDEVNASPDSKKAKSPQTMIISASSGDTGIGEAWRGEALQSFENSAFGSIRVLVIDSEPWFIGKDVAETMGYSNPSKAVMVHVDDEDKQFLMLPVSDSQNGNLVKTVAINSFGIYSLMLSSKMPNAKQILRWVTHDVLPSVRENMQVLGKLPVAQNMPVRSAETGSITTNVLNIDGIECYEKDNVVYLKLETVARGLGFTQTETKNGVTYTTIRWKRVFGLLDEIGFDHKWSKDEFIPENVFYRLAMKAKNEVAEAFQAKIADDVIPSIRRHGAYISDRKLEEIKADPEAAVRLIAEIEEEREINRKLQLANDMLAKQGLTLEKRDAVNRLIRVFSSRVCHNDFRLGWLTFYQTLYYKKGIRLKQRSGNGAYLDRVKPGEWNDVLAVAAAMCQANGIDLVQAINPVNAEMIAEVCK